TAEPRTSLNGPLKAAGMRYRLQVTQVPRRLGVAESFPLAAKGTNQSELPWPSLGGDRIALGYRWLRPNRQEAPNVPAGRIWLSNDVRPSETAALEADVLSPVVPGDYILELEMAQDHLRRFSEVTGQKPLHFPVTLELPVLAQARGGKTPAR